jgi:uncharacterized membrane protein
LNKLIVTVFKDETSAYQGVKALQQLHWESALTVYATAVIAKDANGAITIKQQADEGPLGTLIGMTTGGLVGLIGGPVGMVAGAAAGTLMGSLYDIAEIGISGDFWDEALKQLSPGKVAVIAEVDEDWVTPLDARMEPLGGVVFRRIRSEFVDQQIEREIAADQAEIAMLKAERDQAVGEAKAKLKAKIDAAEARLRARSEQLKQRIEASKREAEAKVTSLQEQVARAKGDAKAKLEKRMAQERAGHKVRVEKLSQAWELVKEAARV